MFKKYHYLDHKLHNAAQQFVGVINGELVAHTGIIQFPMRKGWKRVHRLVVLPDYQGIGIGTEFIDEVSEIYKNEGFKMNLTTTTPALIHALKRSQKWSLFRASRMRKSINEFSRYANRGKTVTKSPSQNRITFSFNYK